MGRHGQAPRRDHQHGTRDVGLRDPTAGVSIPPKSHGDACTRKLRELGEDAPPALARGLADPHAQLRRNVALFLNVVSATWFYLTQGPLDIQASLPALIAALHDRDVRRFAGRAIGMIDAQR